MARKSQVKPKTQTSVETGVTILTYAISEGVSMAEASRQHGKGRNYVSDIKARVKDNYEKKNINRETYRLFNRTQKAYEKTFA